MNPEVKKKWVEALRSGEYNQTKDKLRDTTGYCCLGVLCDIYKQDHDVKWETIDGVLVLVDRFGFRIAYTTLPVIVRDWAELKSADGKYNNSDNCLSNDNDQGKTFLEIADIIEEKF